MGKPNAEVVKQDLIAMTTKSGVDFTTYTLSELKDLAKDLACTLCGTKSPKTIDNRDVILFISKHNDHPGLRRYWHCKGCGMVGFANVAI